MNKYRLKNQKVRVRKAENPIEIMKIKGKNIESESKMGAIPMNFRKMSQSESMLFKINLKKESERDFLWQINRKESFWIKKRGKTELECKEGVVLM